jgi:hypothetical protein
VGGMSAVILSYHSLTRAPTSEVTASSRTSGEISTMTALAGRALRAAALRRTKTV